MRPRTTENSCLAQENPRNLAGLLAERSGGGFVSSPDVPARALGPRIIDSLHAGCRVERETSGLTVDADPKRTAGEIDGHVVARDLLGNRLNRDDLGIENISKVLGLRRDLGVHFDVHLRATGPTGIPDL